MKLDDPSFCVGTYLSQQLGDGCSLQHQEALLSKLQLTLADTRVQSEALAVQNAPLLRKGREKMSHAQREVDDLNQRQQDTRFALQRLDEEFVLIHAVQCDLECLDHAQDYVNLVNQAEDCANAVRDLALNQAKQHKQQDTTDNKTQQPNDQQQQSPDYSKLEPLCQALKRVVSFETQPANSELRTMLTAHMRHLFITLKPHLLEVVYALLKVAGWPQAPKRGPLALSFALRCTLFGQKIELEGSEETAEVVMCGPNSLIGIMIKPIALRFRFHFSDKQTSNRVDKPEWMTAFLLQVVQDHSTFISEVIQPLALECGINRNVLHDFIRATYDIARSKFERQLTQLMASSPDLFRHIVDELIEFEKKIQESHYPTPGLITILSKASLFKQWLGVDRRALEDAMETLRALPKPWDMLQQNVERTRSQVQLGEGVGATVVGDAFLALLARFSSRYVVLPSLDLRLRFLETVQLKAVKRFWQHLRASLQDQLSLLEQNKSERWRLACGMLSTVHYVIVSLTEWADSASFLELALHQAQCSALEAGLPFSHTSYFPTVFEAALEPYTELLSESTQQLVDIMVDGFQARCSNYHLSDEKQRSLGEAVLSLKWQLSQLSEHLGLTSVYRSCLRGVCSGLDQLLFGVVAEEGLFDEKVAAQFVSDVQALWLLFPESERHFPYLRDAVTVLSMPPLDLQKLTAHLANLSPLDHRAVLSAHSIFKMDQFQVDSLWSRIDASDDG